jgi:hypothetical protein
MNNDHFSAFLFFLRVTLSFVLLRLIPSFIMTLFLKLYLEASPSFSSLILFSFIIFSFINLLFISFKTVLTSNNKRSKLYSYYFLFTLLSLFFIFTGVGLFDPSIICLFFIRKVHLAGAALLCLWVIFHVLKRLYRGRLGGIAMKRSYVSGIWTFVYLFLLMLSGLYSPLLDLTVEALERLTSSFNFTFPKFLFDRSFYKFLI